MLGLYPSVMLVVKDLGLSLRFYKDQLGLAMMDQDDWDGHRVAYLTQADFHLVLFQQPSNEHIEGATPKGDGVLLNFNVSSLSKLAEELKLTGTPILRDLVNAPWGEKTLMVTDPDGYAVLLAEQTSGVS